MSTLYWDVFDEFLDRGQRAQRVAEHLAYHGPGPTFGELAIGDRFTWAPKLGEASRPHRPGFEYWKVSATTYEFWIRGQVDGRRGYGTAEDFYRVERW